VWQEEGIWTARPIGKVSSLFYFSPFDVSDLSRNFDELFAEGREGDDYFLSMALGNIDTQRMNIISKAEKKEINNYSNKIKMLYAGKFYNESAVKAGFCYYGLLNGTKNKVLGGMQRGLLLDYPRISQVLQALDSFTGKWHKQKWFRLLESRMRQGIPMHLVDLCQLSGIAKVRATKLYNSGITSVDDVAEMSVENLSKLLNMRGETVKAILDEAKRLSLT
jgi:replicative superfamily II helicase